MECHHHPRRLAPIDALETCHQPLPLLAMPRQAVFGRQHHDGHQTVLKRVPERRVLCQLSGSAKCAVSFTPVPLCITRMLELCTWSQYEMINVSGSIVIALVYCFANHERVNTHPLLGIRKRAFNATPHSPLDEYFILASSGQALDASDGSSELWPLHELAQSEFPSGIWGTKISSSYCTMEHRSTRQTCTRQTEIIQ